MKWCKPVVLFCYSFVHSLSIICKSEIHKETQLQFLRIWYNHDQFVKEFIEGLLPRIWFGSKRNLRDHKLCKPLGTKMAQKGTSNCHQPMHTMRQCQYKTEMILYSLQPAPVLTTNLNCECKKWTSCCDWTARVKSWP